MVLKLYKLDASPPVRSVLCVIELLDIPDVQYENVNLLEMEQLSESFLKINPQHTVPTLVDDDFVIIDSHAIVTYLISKYGEDDSLYPTDLKKRAIIDHKLHFDSGILFPALRGTLAPVLFGGEQSFRPENLEKIKAGYDFIEKFLTGPWLAGDELTVADICCVTSISTLNEMVPIDEVTYPNLSAWLKRCSEQEFYKKVNVPGLEILSAVIKTKIA